MPFEPLLLCRSEALGPIGPPAPQDFESIPSCSGVQRWAEGSSSVIRAIAGVWLRYSLRRLEVGASVGIIVIIPVEGR